jgi:protein-S-isoprenylcysteine O-methyltransferase Ste14
MFIATAFVLISIAMIATDLLLLIGTGGMILLMIIWAPREEQLLIKEFGDQYLDYMKVTGRFIPKRQKSKN